jgi:hypothetical protein
MCICLAAFLRLARQKRRILYSAPCGCRTNEQLMKRRSYMANDSTLRIP